MVVVVAQGTGLFLESKNRVCAFDVGHCAFAVCSVPLLGDNVAVGHGALESQGDAALVVVCVKGHFVLAEHLAAQEVETLHVLVGYLCEAVIQTVGDEVAHGGVGRVASESCVGVGFVEFDYLLAHIVLAEVDFDFLSRNLKFVLLNLNFFAACEGFGVEVYDGGHRLDYTGAFEELRREVGLCGSILTARDVEVLCLAFFQTGVIPHLKGLCRVDAQRCEHRL